MYLCFILNLYLHEPTFACATIGCRMSVPFDTVAVIWKITKIPDFALPLLCVTCLILNFLPINHMLVVFDEWWEFFWEIIDGVVIVDFSFLGCGCRFLFLSGEHGHNVLLKG